MSLSTDLVSLKKCLASTILSRDKNSWIVYLLCSISPAFRTRFYLRPPISDQLFLLSINLLTTFLCALYVGKLTFSVRKNTGLFFGVGIFTSRTPSPISLACKGGIMQMFFHLCQECRAVPKMNSDRCDGLTDWRKRARLSDTFLHISCLWKCKLFLRSTGLYLNCRRYWVFTDQEYDTEKNIVCYKLWLHL